MRNRILIAVAAVATLSLLGATVATGSDDFIDVPNSNIFHDDIGWMEENGITFGYGDGTYGPHDNVTRGQMSAFMHRLYDRVQQDIPDLSDPDVINEIAQIVNIESLCEVFGFQPGSQECEDGLAEILEGPQGPQGPAGADGADGADGEDGVSGYEVVREIRDSGWNTANNSSDAVIAECPEGKVVVGGGYDVNETSWVNGIHSSAPRTDGASVFNTPIGEYQAPNQWDVRVDASNEGLKVAAFAICTDIG